MRKFNLAGVILLLSFSQFSLASTPTETLKIAVDKLISVAADSASDDKLKKQMLTEIISQEVNFEAVSKRVVSKPWRKATDQQKAEFKQNFKQVMVDTYFVLLKKFTNEKVIFTKEQLKKKKYAIVDTQIISDNKKIPVRYRMIKTDGVWKIYDFIPEGISLLSTYKGNYATVLKKKGMQGLLEEMNSTTSKENKE